MDSVRLKQLEREIPFDQFSRQYKVMTMLNELHSKGRPFKILDVGGYKGRTADFLVGDEVTVIDLYDVQEENYVRGSALELPFADASFDFVVSFDVLEHIPADKRTIFFDECNRVAKQGIIICAPHKTAANEYAEQSLNNLYKTLHHKPHQWLREHIAYGIPDFGLLAKQATAKGFVTAEFYSNKTVLWAVMQEAIFINSKFSLASERLDDINEFYNRHFKYDSNDPASAYRVILCCFRDSGQQQAVVKKLNAAAEPPDPKVELELLETIRKFTVSLIQKTTALSNDYKELYEHEQKRAELLSGQITELERRLSYRIRRKVSTTLRSRNHGK